MGSKWESYSVSTLLHMGLSGPEISTFQANGIHTLEEVGHKTLPECFTQSQKNQIFALVTKVKNIEDNAKEYVTEMTLVLNNVAKSNPAMKEGCDWMVDELGSYTADQSFVGQLFAAMESEKGKVILLIKDYIEQLKLVKFIKTQSYSADEEINKLEEKVAGNLEEIDRLKQIVTENRETIRRKKDELDEATNVSSKWLTKSDTLEKKIKMLETNLEEVKAISFGRLKKLKKQKKIYRKFVKKLGKMKTISSRRLAKLMKLKKIYRKVVMKLESEKADSASLRDELEEVQERLAQAETEYDLLRERNAETFEYWQGSLVNQGV